MVGRDAVESAMIDVIHVPPEVPVFAAAVGAKVRPCARIGKDESAARDEVTRRRDEKDCGTCRNSCDRQHSRRNDNRDDGCLD